MSEIQRAAVGATVCVFAIGTTATLHFVCKPYVLRIMLNSADASSMQLQTLGILGQKKITTVGMKELTMSGDRIFSTFQDAKGNPFYIHEERAMFGDDGFYEALMKQLGIKPEPEVKSEEPTEE